MKLWPFSKKSENPTIMAGGGVKAGKMELPQGVMLASPDEEPFPPKTIEMHPGVYQGKSTALASSVTENIPVEQKETEPSLADLSYIPIEEAPPTEEKTGKIDLSQFFEQHQLEVISQAPPISPASPALPTHHAVNDTPKPDSGFELLQSDNAEPIPPAVQPSHITAEAEASKSFYLESGPDSPAGNTLSLAEMAAFLGTEDFSVSPSNEMTAIEALPDFFPAPPHTSESTGLTASDAAFDAPIEFKSDFSTPETEQFSFFDAETLNLSESTLSLESDDIFAGTAYAATENQVDSLPGSPADDSIEDALNPSLIQGQISQIPSDLENPSLFPEEHFDAFEYPSPELIRQPQPAPLNLSIQDLAPPEDEAGSSENNLSAFSIPATDLPGTLETQIDGIFSESGEDLFTDVHNPIAPLAFSAAESLPIALHGEESLPDTLEEMHYYGDEAEGLKGDDNLDSYDFGHYSDPDEPETAFVLDEEDLIEEAPASQEAVMPPADFQPEKSLPASPVKPETPSQASAFTSSRHGKRYPETLADHLGSFEQETLLKDSRFLKKSIDHLVNSYFALTESENH